MQFIVILFLFSGWGVGGGEGRLFKVESLKVLIGGGVVGVGAYSRLGAY